MFFDTKQKILFVAAVVILLFAVASTVARFNRQPKLSPEMQEVVPLEAPRIIELEDDAGVGK